MPQFKFTKNDSVEKEEKSKELIKLSATSILHDARTNCFSIIFQIKTTDYLNLVENAYKEKGGLASQREPLKSSSALRIRKRMVSDILEGSILPPIVIGLVVDEEVFNKIPSLKNNEFSVVLNSVAKGNLTIIDGMQRTTALIEALEQKNIDGHTLRLEFWISNELNSLIYRMLVLNSGQVPWNLRRQIETVFSSMLNEIKTSIPEIDVYTIDENSRRTKGGQYHYDDVIELYLTFGGRKEKVDTKERLADEFTRLDFIEVTKNRMFSKNFYASLKYLVKFDIKVSTYTSKNIDGRFSNGIDLFKSQPARVGFITAIAKKILGRPGIEKTMEEIIEDEKRVFGNLDEIYEKIKNLGSDELGEFLALNLLSEKLSVKSSRVGDFEREFFTKSFDTLLDVGPSIPSLEVCWLSF